MQSLTDKRILLGITGGIAAYKSADLVRRLKEAEADVQVVMTPAATGFITPLTLQALSGRPVRLELLDPEAEAGMGHIELARWADLIVIAPASADFIARLAHGFADDLLSTLCLASDKPIALAPAMNRLMWSNPATQANCKILESRAIRLWGPGSGGQACGETGDGRMLEPLQIREQVIGFFSHGAGPLTGLTVLITAGPTREALDPVRFISNNSSGKMGFAVADAAVRAGAGVRLVSGPVNLTTPAGSERIDVESAAEMYDAVMAHAAEADIFIAVAAVADYRPARQAAQKIKKHSETLSLELERNPDILSSVAALAKRPFCVGFAAETENVLAYAGDKRKRKNLDMIAANRVGVSDRGFDSDQNTLHVLWEGGEKALPMADKSSIGRDLIALIAERYHAGH
jgi:phosphopantothenoylcysteine decarboxylase/phosphopantothenate--cysteine ligase